MSLVADYGSDASSSEEETNVQNVTETTIMTKKPSISSLLPPPKSKRTGPVKIMVDLPKSDKDDNDSDEEQGLKQSKPGSSNGSGLFALLPAPKRSATSKEQNSSTNKSVKASTSFVP